MQYDYNVIVVYSVLLWLETKKDKKYTLDFRLPPCTEYSKLSLG